jgi:flagellar basal body-associated protein FliL
MTSLSVATQLKDFPILIIIGVALIIGILGIIIKYFNKKSIAPRSNSSEQSSSSQSEDLISVKEDLLRKSPNSNKLELSLTLILNAITLPALK